MKIYYSILAFRGFGGPQGLFGCETIVEHVASHLKLDPLVIRRLNMYKEGDLTHFGQPLERWNIPRLMDELLKSSDFHQRQKTVQEFNQLHTYRKTWNRYSSYKIRYCIYSKISQSSSCTCAYL